MRNLLLTDVSSMIAKLGIVAMLGLSPRRNAVPENGARSTVKTRGLGWAGLSSCKSLISFTNIHAERSHSGGEEIGRCVFFTQDLAEIVQFGLWAGQFFIACRNSSDKVIVRRRGEP